MANHSSRLKHISNKLKAQNHSSNLRMSTFIKMLENKSDISQGAVHRRNHSSDNLQVSCDFLVGNLLKITKPKKDSPAKSKKKGFKNKSMDIDATSRVSKKPPAFLQKTMETPQVVSYTIRTRRGKNGAKEKTN